MKKVIYTIILFIISIFLLLNIHTTNSKYVITTKSMPSVHISIDKEVPEVIIKDANNKIINNEDEAIHTVDISYKDEVSGVYSAIYKYNPNEDSFEGIESNKLENNTKFKDEGWYYIEVTDVAGNTTIYHFYLKSAVCRIGQIYFDSIMSAVDTIKSDYDEVTEIIMLTNTQEDVVIDYNKKVKLNIDNYEIIGNFNIKSGSSLSTENGKIKSINDKPVFSNNGVLNIINGEYESENANTVEIIEGSCTIDGGSIKQMSSGYYYTILVSQGQLNLEGNATITGNYIGIRAERSSHVVISNGVISTNICAAASYNHSIMEIEKNAILKTNGAHATVTNMAILKIRGGTITQLGTGNAIDVQGINTEISDNAKIISYGINTIKISNKADVKITGGDIQNIGSGTAINLNNRSSDTCIVKISNNANITGEGNYTIYVSDSSQTLTIVGGTIKNTNSGYAIYSESENTTVEGATIIGRTYY